MLTSQSKLATERTTSGSLLNAYGSELRNPNVSTAIVAAKQYRSRGQNELVEQAAHSPTRWGFNLFHPSTAYCWLHRCLCLRLHGRSALPPLDNDGLCLPWTCSVQLARLLFRRSSRSRTCHAIDAKANEGSEPRFHRFVGTQQVAHANRGRCVLEQRER